MKNMSKVKATCESCNHEFELQGVEVETEPFKEGKLTNALLSALYFSCSNCGAYNSYAFEDLSLVS